MTKECDQQLQQMELSRTKLAKARLYLDLLTAQAERDDLEERAAKASEKEQYQHKFEEHSAKVNAQTAKEIAKQRQRSAFVGVSAAAAAPRPSQEGQPGQVSDERDPWDR
jgi:hypothetical protein